MPNLKTMSKRIFTQEQISELRNNKNVATCSEKSVTYHPDFKMTAVKRYQEGLSPSFIFIEAGFNLAVLGREIPKECLRRWLAIARVRGAEALRKDGRTTNNPRGKPGNHDLTNLNDQEKLTYLETQVAYLKAENAFLAKLRKRV
jgi:hypothetical protein